MKPSDLAEDMVLLEEYEDEDFVEEIEISFEDEESDYDSEDDDNEFRSDYAKIFIWNLLRKDDTFLNEDLEEESIMFSDDEIVERDNAYYYPNSNSMFKFDSEYIRSEPSTSFFVPGKVFCCFFFIK